MKEQEDPTNSVFSIICSILYRYGGETLIQENAVVNDALLLLSSIFTYNPIESMEAETVRSCWMAVLYVFDTILCTYNTGEQHMYREVPPAYAEDVSVPRDQPSRSEEEERVVVETLHIVCFLHSIFFAAVPIVEELGKDYVLESMNCFLAFAATSYDLLCILFYGFGCAVTHRWCEWLE